MIAFFFSSVSHCGKGHESFQYLNSITALAQPSFRVLNHSDSICCLYFCFSIFVFIPDWDWSVVFFPAVNIYWVSALCATFYDLTSRLFVFIWLCILCGSRHPTVHPFEWCDLLPHYEVLTSWDFKVWFKILLGSSLFVPFIWDFCWIQYIFLWSIVEFF